MAITNFYVSTDRRRFQDVWVKIYAKHTATYQVLDRKHKTMCKRYHLLSVSGVNFSMLAESVVPRYSIALPSLCTGYSLSKGHDSSLDSPLKCFYCTSVRLNS